MRTSASGSFISTNTGTMVAVNGGKAVMMSSGASETMVHIVRAAAADANLEFREVALSAKDLIGDSSSVIGVRGATCAFSLGKVFEHKSRALVNIWQQQGQLQQHQRHFLSVLNSHLVRSIDRCPLFIPPRL